MLFNKILTGTTGSGAAEMKSLLGFIYASNKFDNLIPLIEMAEYKLSNSIGPELIAAAQVHYNSDLYNVAGQSDPALLVLDKLVRKIQLPVAYEAYRRFAPSNDLTHSDKGRQMISTETEKHPFPWMIDRDNLNLLTLTNDFTDMLFVFLAENSKPFKNWSTEAEYKAGEYVKFDGIFYKVLQNHESLTVNDDIALSNILPCYCDHITPIAWPEIVQPAGGDGTNPATEIVAGEFRMIDGVICECMQTHTPTVLVDDQNNGMWGSPLHDASLILFEWTGSEAYSLCSNLMVQNTRQFNYIYDIKNSARLYFALLPIMRQIQNDIIKPCFLLATFNEIIEQMNFGNLTIQNAKYITLARPALVYLTLAQALISLSIEIVPDSICQRFSVDINQDKTDRIEMSQKIQALGMSKLKSLQEEIAQVNCVAAGIEYVAPSSTNQDPTNKFFRL